MESHRGKWFPIVASGILLTVLFLPTVVNGQTVIKFSGDAVAVGEVPGTGVVGDAQAVISGRFSYLGTVNLGAATVNLRRLLFDAEGIYRDLDGSGKVSKGDIRVSVFGLPSTTVAATSPDVAEGLIAFLAGEKHTDPNGNNRFDATEGIYLDVDGSGDVSEGDVRLSVRGFASESVVVAGDPDEGTSLIAFGATEKHTDPEGSGDFDARELVKGTDEVDVVPITLPARAGGTPTSALYLGDSSARPTFRVQIQNRGGGAFDFSIRVDRATIPENALRCASGKTTTGLATDFVINDGVNAPVTVSKSAIWRCLRNELRTP